MHSLHVKIPTTILRTISRHLISILQGGPSFIFLTIKEQLLIDAGVDLLAVGGSVY